MTENIASTPTTVIALRYDGTGAPHVTAQGEGYMAQQILKVAAEHGIPLYEDKNLASLLSKIELGAEIPTNLYVAVAQVLAFVYTLSGKTPKHLAQENSIPASRTK